MSNFDEMIPEHIQNLPPGQLEYFRRWLLCHKAIQENRWAAVKKWAILCDKGYLYNVVKRLHDKGIDLSDGFI